MAYRNDPEVARYQSCDSLAVPAANAMGVASGVDVTATISGAMKTNSINGTTFKLSKVGTTTAITDL